MPDITISLTEAEQTRLAQLFDLAITAAPAGNKLQTSSAALAILQKVEQGRNPATRGPQILSRVDD